MTPDDEETPTPQPPLSARPLDRMGISELERYIAGLRVEITRAEAEITRKHGFKEAADSVFKR